MCFPQSFFCRPRAPRRSPHGRSRRTRRRRRPHPFFLPVFLARSPRVVVVVVSPSSSSSSSSSAIQQHFWVQKKGALLFLSIIILSSRRSSTKSRVSSSKRRVFSSEEKRRTPKKKRKVFYLVHAPIYVIRITHPLVVRFFLQRTTSRERETKRHTPCTSCSRARRYDAWTLFFFFDLRPSCHCQFIVIIIIVSFCQMLQSSFPCHRLVCVVCVVGYIFFFFGGFNKRSSSLSSSSATSSSSPSSSVVLLLFLSLDGRHEQILSAKRGYNGTAVVHSGSSAAFNRKKRPSERTKKVDFGIKIAHESVHGRSRRGGTGRHGTNGERIL